MNRSFDLRIIGFANFNRLCRGLSVLEESPTSSRYSDQREFYKFLDSVKYVDLADVLEDVADGRQVVDCVWSPKKLKWLLPKGRCKVIAMGISIG